VALKAWSRFWSQGSRSWVAGSANEPLRLRAVTNLRVVPDEQSANGYRIEIGPFPGWAKVPEW